MRADLAAERSTEAFAWKKAVDTIRREEAQAGYVEDFQGAVAAFLASHPSHADLAARLARVVTDHATPVGSGTVARTKRIPVGRRAEVAVIAWLRHQTTGYDRMAIRRVTGQRREVRWMLARRSHELLARHRRGETAPDSCPVRAALSRAAPGVERTAGRAVWVIAGVWPGFRQVTSSATVRVSRAAGSWPDRLHQECGPTAMRPAWT